MSEGKKEILLGDCLELMKGLPENSVDAIVTDPPYGLEFMGKDWDNTGIANNVDMWKECMRVLKSGGHLLAFGGTRTYHRMACAIEDAGFEIRDMIEWVYGSGFPKSYNLGKGINKYLKTGNASWNGTGDSSNGALGYSKLQHKQGYRPKDYSNKHKGKKKITEDKAKQWEGWGTALKPAHEPICMARKPLAEKTVALNVLKYGTGGINIDESRVEAEPELAKNWDRKAPAGFGNGMLNEKYGLQTEGFKDNAPTGRFPANLIHDGSDEVRECFPETKSGKLKSDCYEKDRENDSMFAGGENFTHKGYDADSGNASRFFKSIPAHEPICMARKPLSEKTVAENCLKWGTGGINIDESRVETDEKWEGKKLENAKSLTGYEGGDGLNKQTSSSHEQGRFPANLIHDNSEEVRECFPETGKGGYPKLTKDFTGKSNITFRGAEEREERINLDSGNASRFFKSIIYQAKASKRERNKGCEELEEKKTSTRSEEVLLRSNYVSKDEMLEIGEYIKSKMDISLDELNAKFGYVAGCNWWLSKNPNNIRIINPTDYQKLKEILNLDNRYDDLLLSNLYTEPKSLVDVAGKKSKNFHPTVKPIALMEYLIKMVSREGAVILDPFGGSGTTGVACLNTNRQFIVMEKEEKYHEIIKARVAGFNKKFEPLTLFGNEM